MVLLFYHILMLFQQHNANRNQFVTHPTRSRNARHHAAGQRASGWCGWCESDPPVMSNRCCCAQMTVHRYLFRSMSRVVDFDAIQSDLRHYGDVFSSRRDGVDTL
jgi:hypothetical protein